MRLAVYTDFPYHRDADGTLWAEQAFGLFLEQLRPPVGGLVVLGRLDPDPRSARHRLSPAVDLVALPHYGSLTDLPGVVRALMGSLVAFWRTLARVDAVWLLGPHPLSILFAGLAAARRRRVFLGVRLDMPAYMEERYRERPFLRMAARVLEAAYRLLSRRCPTVVVGPLLARNYSRARGLLSVAISLVDPGDICAPHAAISRDYGGELTILSVGRLDPEKNPMLLADIFADLASDEEDRWRLVVCGDGPLKDALWQRLEELGVAAGADLRGYVPYEEGMRDLYRQSHFLLLTSWTEGLPQVALEAFAAGLPVVTTRVGGLPDAAPDAVSTFPAGAADEGASILRALRGDPPARESLMRAGIRWVASHTAQAEAERLAAFLRSWTE
jgi:glycosyltransferase involved in cell wall biosynthesis